MLMFSFQLSKKLKNYSCQFSKRINKSIVLHIYEQNLIFHVSFLINVIEMHWVKWLDEEADYT